MVVREVGKLCMGTAVSPFDLLTQMLQRLPAPSAFALDMSVGVPQVEIAPAALRELHADGGTWRSYPPVEGTLQLREAYKGWLRRRFGVPAEVFDGHLEVLPIAGIKEGLTSAGAFLASQLKDSSRNQILIPEPCYSAYYGLGSFSGIQAKSLPYEEGIGQPALERLTADDLKRVFAIILCSPANPQGTLASEQYLQNAIQLTLNNDIMLLVDECYVDLHISAPCSGAIEACYRGKLDFRNLLVFHSLSKRSNAAGLRSAMVCGHKSAIEMFRQFRSLGAAQVPLAVQRASAYLWNNDDLVEATRLDYCKRVLVAKTALAGIPDIQMPEAGFFLWLPVEDDLKAASDLWTQEGIKVLPGSFLLLDRRSGSSSPAHIRVALIHDPAQIYDALQRLRRVIF